VNVTVPVDVPVEPCVVQFQLPDRIAMLAGAGAARAAAVEIDAKAIADTATRRRTFMLCSSFENINGYPTVCV
jgi:hypothetical protein